MENPSSNPVPPAPSKAPRILALIWMILSQLLACLIIFGGLGYLWLGSQMGDGSIPANIGTFMFLFPVVYVIPIGAAWFCYAKQKTGLALILTSLPLVLFCLEAVIFGAMVMGYLPSP